MICIKMSTIGTHFFGRRAVTMTFFYLYITYIYLFFNILLPFINELTVSFSILKIVKSGKQSYYEIFSLLVNRFPH